MKECRSNPVNYKNGTSSAFSFLWHINEYTIAHTLTTDEEMFIFGNLFGNGALQPFQIFQIFQIFQFGMQFGNLESDWNEFGTQRLPVLMKEKLKVS